MSPVKSDVDDAFGGYDLELENRHIVLHGVEPAATPTATVW